MDILIIIIAISVFIVVGLIIALIILLRKQNWRNRCANCGFRLKKLDLQCPHCGNRRLINEKDIPGYK